MRKKRGTFTRCWFCHKRILSQSFKIHFSNCSKKPKPKRRKRIFVKIISTPMGGQP